MSASEVLQSIHELGNEVEADLYRLTASPRPENFQTGLQYTEVRAFYDKVKRLQDLFVQWTQLSPNCRLISCISPHNEDGFGHVHSVITRDEVFEAQVFE